MEKIMQCCCVNFILSVSILSVGASLALEKGVMVNRTQEAQCFFRSILPAISVDHLKQKLENKDFIHVIRDGGIEEIKKYVLWVNTEHQGNLTLLASLTPLPSVLINLIDQYRNDGLDIEKGVLVRNYFLRYMGSSEESNNILLSLQNLPVIELSLLLDILINVDNCFDHKILIQYIDHHYPMGQDNDRLKLFNNAALTLHDLTKKKFFTDPMYSQFKELFLWLIKRGVSIDKQYGWPQRTLLHYAIRKRDKVFFQQLLAMGANANIPDHRGRTARGWLRHLKLDYME